MIHVTLVLFYKFWVDSMTHKVNNLHPYPRSWSFMIAMSLFSLSLSGRPATSAPIDPVRRHPHPSCHRASSVRSRPPLPPHHFLAPNIWDAFGSHAAGERKKITLLCLSVSSPRLLSASNSMANRLGLTSPLHLILLPMRSMCSCIESISTPFTAIVVDTGLDPFVPRESPPSAPFVGIANNEGCVASMLNA
jgi:hypothetical protein